VIAGEPRVHEPGDEAVVRGLTIVVDALDERRSAITDADDGNSNGSHDGLLARMARSLLRGADVV